jgi:hypothetical protein
MLRKGTTGSRKGTIILEIKERILKTLKLIEFEG